MATKFWQVKGVLLAIATVFMAQGLASAEPPAAVRNAVTAPQAASYWIMTDRTRTRLVPNQIAFNSQQPTGQVLSAAFGQLLNDAEFASQHSAIPPKTKLLSLRVQPNGIYVNLSREFLQGGGSTSMINRLTQVVYTATSLNPDAQVYLSVDGQILDENNPLAGEGLMVRYPINRQQLEQDFPMQ